MLKKLYLWVVISPRLVKIWKRDKYRKTTTPDTLFKFPATCMLGISWAECVQLFLLTQSLEEHFYCEFIKLFLEQFLLLPPPKNSIAMNVIMPCGKGTSFCCFFNLLPNNFILKETEESTSGHTCYREVIPRFMRLALLHQVSHQEGTEWACTYVPTAAKEQFHQL